MKKGITKNKIVATTLLFNIAFAFFVQPMAAMAVYTPPDPDLNVSTISESNYFFITVNGFKYVEYMPAVAAIRDFDGAIMSEAAPFKCIDSLDNPNDVIVNANPASGFCAAVEKCTAPSLTCKKAVAESYNHKILDALAAATDAKIASSGLDNNKANNALESCGGDLACIDKVLTALGADSVFTQGAASDSNAPLTAAGLSDIINSNNTSSDTGPLNTAANDQGGLLGKTPGPKVDVNFNSSGFGQAGGKITARAVPSFFNNASDPKNLYFTWYLKRADCNKTGTITEINRSCDLDEDGKISENDWKIAAAKIIVAKSFDSSGANYSTNIVGNTAGYIAIPEIIKEKGGNTNIGWRNGFLENGDNLYKENGANDDVPNCYAQAPDSGRVYEIRKAKSTFENECQAGYHRACVSNQKTACNVLNPGYDLVAARAEQDAREWNEVNKPPTDYPRPVPSVYSIPQTDPAYKQSDKDAVDAAILAVNSWNANNKPPLDWPRVVPASSLAVKVITNEFDACAISTEKNDNSDVKCSIKDDEALKNFKTNVSCNESGTVPICIKDDYSNAELKDSTQKILGVIVGTRPGDSGNNNKMCTAVAKPYPNLVNPIVFWDNTEPLIKRDAELCSVVKNGIIDGTKDSNGKTVITGNANLNPKCSFEKSDNLCKHLFPVLPRRVKTDNGKRAVSGDGEFNISEKRFWGDDPTKASTSGTGKDEENVVGLGVDSFEWMFSTGDQVGVVVEGDSAFPSDHQDASYKRMWAFSNGTCKALDDMEKRETINSNEPSRNTRGFYIDGSKGILTAEVDLNDCLEENLLEPDSASNSELTVQLNAMPENPINDPNGSKGDILNITSSATNTQNPSGLLYSWFVQKSKDGSSVPIDTTSWMDINGGSFSESDIVGLGKKDLAINLNIKDSVIKDGMRGGSYSGVFYLKIKVKISGTAADGSQNAEGTVTVRVKQQKNEMHVYPAIATTDGGLNLPEIDKASLELCNNKQGKISCYVNKNQIIGLEVPDTIGGGNLSSFSWTINGTESSCTSAISSQCTTPRGNKLFVPILGNVGEAVDVVATALNEKNESVAVSRHFVISEEGLQIVSSDPNSFCGLQCLDNSNACPKYLGHYNDLDGAQYPDCSTQVWETNEGKTVTLGATGQTGFDWAIDGQIIPEYKDQNQIQLAINKVAGESYNIGLSTHLLPENKIQLNNIRRALQKNWGVAPEEELIAENQSANMQLDVVGGSAQSVAAAKQSIFGASLITHLPEQLMFLLKISLTSLMLLLTTGLLFAFMPGALFKEKE